MNTKFCSPEVETLCCDMLFDGYDFDLGEEICVHIPPSRCWNQASVLRLENKSLSY